MIDISTWTELFLHTLTKTFPERVWFVGLQGSYGRSEATETSDIDMVVILDELSVEDIQAYHAMLDTLPHRKLICGFLSGKREILNWDPADLFQLYYDTKPIRGSLDALQSLLDDSAVSRAIKMGVCNIFHGCVHNMLYNKSEKVLKGLYKTASFVVQAISFQQTGKYTRRQKELLAVAAPDERVIVETFMRIKNGEVVDFQKLSEILFTWSKKWIEITK